MREACLIVAFLAWNGILSAQDRVPGYLFEAKLASPLGSNLVIADVDNDRKADIAVLFRGHPLSSRNGSRVELHLSHHPPATIDFDSTEYAISISARDVDDDDDVDLVIERSLTEQGLRVWLNDGRGSFTEGHVRTYPCLSQPAREKLVAPACASVERAVALAPQRGTEFAALASVPAVGPNEIAATAVRIHETARVLRNCCSDRPARAPPISSIN